MAGEGEFGDAPPACPENYTNYIAYPSVVIIFAVMCLLSLVFALVCAFKYNKVQVLLKKFTSSKISNSAWTAYFLLISISALTSAIEYSVANDLNSAWTTVSLAMSLIFHGFVAFALTYALHHQVKFRSGSAPPSTSKGQLNPDTSTTSLGTLYGSVSTKQELSQKITKIKTKFGIVELCYVILLGIYLISTLFLFIFNYNNIAEAIFMGFYFVQQIPSFVLIIMIIVKKNASSTGPKVLSKVFLGLGALLGLVGEIPLRIWAGILPDTCVFVIGSWVDLIHLIYAASIFFFFLFIRSEYKRNISEYQWDAVNEIEKTFGEGRF